MGFNSGFKGLRVFFYISTFLSNMLSYVFLDSVDKVSVLPVGLQVPSCPFVKPELGLLFYFVLT